MAADKPESGESGVEGQGGRPRGSEPSGPASDERTIDLTGEVPPGSEPDIDLIANPYLVDVDREDQSRSTAPERVATKTKTIAEAQEAVRGRLAQWLTGGAVVLVFFFAVAAAAKWLSPDDVKTLAAVILSPLVGLAGSAAGFYFGQKS